MADSGRMEAPRGPWSDWETGFKDEHTKTLGRNFEIAVKNLRLPREQEACIADMARLMQRLYDDLPPRNDRALPIAHILRVAAKLARRGKGGYGIADVNIILAALAHDGVEDHAEALARLGTRTGKNDHAEALQYVHDAYGEDARIIVSHTTHKKDGAPRTRGEKIRDYVNYVSGVTADPRALLVKISDVCDNVNFPSPEIAQRAYSMEKYWNAIPELQAGVRAHKEYILALGGHHLYIQITLDLLAARRRAAHWKRLASAT